MTSPVDVNRVFVCVCRWNEFAGERSRWPTTRRCLRSLPVSLSSTCSSRTTSSALPASSPASDGSYSSRTPSGRCSSSPSWDSSANSSGALAFVSHDHRRRLGAVLLKAKFHYAILVADLIADLFSDLTFDKFMRVCDQLKSVTV